MNNIQFVVLFFLPIRADAGFWDIMAMVVFVLLVVEATKKFFSPRPSLNTEGISSKTGIAVALPYRGTRRCIYLVRKNERERHGDKGNRPIRTRTTLAIRRKMLV